jgi:hypothetical protein
VVTRFLPAPVRGHPAEGFSNRRLRGIQRERALEVTARLFSALETQLGQAEEIQGIATAHPYLGIESLTGSKEAWFFNGYESQAEQKQVVADYAKNAPLLEALQTSGRRKASLTGKSVEVFATYRKDSSRGVPWRPGQGRFLVITVSKSRARLKGTVFEAPDGTRFIVTPFQSLHQAEATAAADSRIFAVRLSWSYPAEDWIAADPPFWRPSATPHGR